MQEQCRRFAAGPYRYQSRVVGLPLCPAAICGIIPLPGPHLATFAHSEEQCVKYGFIATQGTMPETLELARMVEDHGWDGFFIWDGISVGPMPTWDPWVLLGAVATQTSRVTLGAIVHPLSRRRPWKVAREALTVDHLSGGRLVIPVALGALDDGGFSRVHPEVTDRKQRGAARRDTGDHEAGLAWGALLLQRRALSGGGPRLPANTSQRRHPDLGRWRLAEQEVDGQGSEVRGCAAIGGR